MSATNASWSGQAWSCTVRLVVRDAAALKPASDDLRILLHKVDLAASRFRPDSQLTRANERAGRPTPVSRLLVDLVSAALDAAWQTDGAVDPTLGRAMNSLGYDRDIARLRRGSSTADVPVADEAVARLVAGPRWRAVGLHREMGLLTVPIGTSLDLGATAKAWTADHAARTLADRYDTAVLVELGGDLAVAGSDTSDTSAADGWCVRVAEREGGDGQLITVHRGGLATSTTTLRRWTRAGRELHHIVDPATGLPADGPWRTASVAADTALAANVASTAALVLGHAAVDWLVGRGLAARLVDREGTVTTTPGWPAMTPRRELTTTGAQP